MISRLHLKSLALFLAAFSLWSQRGAADVLTYHNDNARTSHTGQETSLTPANVSSATFGKLFKLSTDGKVDAQPLIVSSVPVTSSSHPVSGRRNLLYVATEHGSLYAVDADDGTSYWQVSLLGSGETPSDDRSCSQVTPEIAITATPAIDLGRGSHGVIYVVCMSKDGSGGYHQRLHAIDLTTGTEDLGGPVEISADFPGHGPGNDGLGHVVFDPAQYKERSALLLAHDQVITSWASHCDIAPYTAWIIGFDASTLQRKSVLNVDPNGKPVSSFLDDGSGSAFWNSGAGPAMDAQGFLYHSSGNGPFDQALDAAGFPQNHDFGDTFLKLRIGTKGGISVADYFTPFDQQKAANQDQDLSSGGVMVVPDQLNALGQAQPLVVAAGKAGIVYLANRNAMGKFHPAGDAIYQRLAGALHGGVFSSPAYFNGRLYYGPVGAPICALQFYAAFLLPSPVARTGRSFPYPGVSPSISSIGAKNGIVWAVENSSPALLRAYRASDLHQLYSSDQASGNRDDFGDGNKFITPSIANGKVYAAVQDGVGVFGLLSPASPTDATATVTSLSKTYDATTGLVTEKVEIINPGTTALTGPVSLVLDNLPAGTWLQNRAGGITTSPDRGSVYINLVAPGNKLRAHQSIRRTLTFIASGTSSVTYTSRLLAGPGTSLSCKGSQNSPCQSRAPQLPNFLMIKHWWRK
ncbi:MAG: PQQ-binding-like beta-propeller repeat protein [Chthoniobacteraceae bacterium]